MNGEVTLGDRNEIIFDLKPIPGEIEMTKPGKGAFYNTSLQQIL